VSEARLDASEEVVHPGQDIVVSPPGDGSLGTGGSLSRFESPTADRWELVYHLVTPVLDGVEPRCIPAGERLAVTTAVGLPGPVVARIPPVPPGRYRIARDYNRADGGHRFAATAAVEVTVV
jgi:hypothetical protein